MNFTSLSLAFLTHIFPIYRKFSIVAYIRLFRRRKKGHRAVCVREKEIVSGVSITKRKEFPECKY
jgi:hypothetical protein